MRQMAKQVVHIYGASGSGTTTLGRKISEELSFTFMDTDNYFWMPTNPPYTEKRDRSERLKLMRHDIECAEHVVISGALSGWGDALIPYFTLAVRLVTDTAIRIERLKKREAQKLGARVEKGGDMYEHHLDFLDWAASYDTGGPDIRSKAEHDRWQQLLPCRQLVLDGAADLEDNVQLVKEALKYKE